MARTRTGVSRRRLLTRSAATAALFAAPSIVRGQLPAPARKVPMRLARDRLEEALARIADPKGEGARACLTVYAQAAISNDLRLKTNRRKMRDCCSRRG